MNWNIEYVKARNYMHIKGEGVFSIEEPPQVFQKILAYEYWKPGIPMLFDNRALDFGATDISIIRKASNIFSQASHNLGKSKVAMLMKSLSDFGLGRQFETFSDGKCQVDMCIFREEEKAISWLLSEDQHPPPTYENRLSFYK